MEPTLQKSPTGIKGFDEITGGGLPKGRPTLIAGDAGSGKTLFAMEFLYRGATQFAEPGVFVTFEETPPDLIKNFVSLGFDIPKAARQKKLVIEHIFIERSEIEETGEYDLEGLFVRLGAAVDSIGAKRIVLDTLESIFTGFANENLLRAELRRLFRWLKEKGLTAVITGERGVNLLTRHGLEEYVSDCVISLDHRMTEQVATRRIRVLKYRGSHHGTNEYPFMITGTGISVLPVTSIHLEHTISAGRVSSGIPKLDQMLDGKGFYRGSSIMITGTAGTGKSSIAGAFSKAACQRGERVLYLAFEESENQIIRNMRSIGIDLAPCVGKGLLNIRAARPTMFGLEMHLVTISDLIRNFKPQAVVVDPISNLMTVGSPGDVRSMLTRLIDHLKAQHITTIFTNLTHPEQLEITEAAISSLIDTWLLIRDQEINGERNRTLNILKSRGMKHSNQVREFVLSDKGIDLIDVYVGSGMVLTGTARLSQEEKEKADELTRRQEITRLENELARRQRILDSQMEELRARNEAEAEQLKASLESARLREKTLQAERKRMAAIREGGKNNGHGKAGGGKR